MYLVNLPEQTRQGLYSASWSVLNPVLNGAFDILYANHEGTEAAVVRCPAFHPSPTVTVPSFLAVSARFYSPLRAEPLLATVRETPCSQDGGVWL